MERPRAYKVIIEPDMLDNILTSLNIKLENKPNITWGGVDLVRLDPPSLVAESYESLLYCNVNQSLIDFLIDFTANNGKHTMFTANIEIQTKIEYNLYMHSATILEYSDVRRPNKHNLTLLGTITDIDDPVIYHNNVTQGNIANLITEGFRKRLQSLEQEKNNIHIYRFNNLEL